MLSRNRIAVVLVVVLFVFGILSFRNCFAAGKIAFVDLGMIFDGYEKTKEYDTKLEGEQGSKQKEIDKKIDEIKKLQDKLPLIAEKEKTSKQTEIDTKTKELQEFQRNAETQLRQTRDERLKEILKDIQDVVEEIAKKDGYDFILNDRVLLYGNESMDISKQILEKLNEIYKKKK